MEYWENALNLAVRGIDLNSSDHDEPEGFSKWNSPIALLGKIYYPPIDKNDFLLDLRSRIYCSYRKNFLPIGSNSGPTSDQGFGCMHRCGQMMMAQALLMVHLGRDWQFNLDQYSSIYARIEDMFHDVRSSTYSIHKIANMGVAEDKEIGHWFGPNTVAQVLKKLAVYDDWSKLVVHVAMEEGIILDELKRVCYSPSTSASNQNACGSSFVHLDFPDNGNETTYPRIVQRNVSEDCVEVIQIPTTLPKRAKRARRLPPSPPTKPIKNPPDSSNLSSKSSGAAVVNDNQVFSNDNQKQWRPLLLIIPLRVGLNKANPQFLSALKKCLELPQSVGILGGWPRHALWIIGHVYDDFVYLDPHRTQPAVVKSSLASDEDGKIYDICYPPSSTTYHTAKAGRLSITQLDPSLAVGFVCTTEESLTELSDLLRREVNHSAGEPLFEVHDTRPKCFFMINRPADAAVANSDDEAPLLSDDLLMSFVANSDSDYEII